MAHQQSPTYVTSVGRTQDQHECDTNHFESNYIVVFNLYTVTYLYTYIYLYIYIIMCIMASLSCSACSVSSFHYTCAWWELADCLHGYSHIHIPKKCESWPLESPWLVVPARCVDQLACVHRKSIGASFQKDGNSVNHGESAMRSSGTPFFWSYSCW